MSVTRPIPAEAAPAVAAILLDVPLRPATLPDFFNSDIMCWPDERWGVRGCCPLGLKPGAMVPFPYRVSDFGRGGSAYLTDTAIKAFTNWWDEQNDPLAAVEAVWGWKLTPEGVVPVPFKDGIGSGGPVGGYCEITDGDRGWSMPGPLGWCEACCSWTPWFDAVGRARHPWCGVGSA